MLVGVCVLVYSVYLYVFGFKYVCVCGCVCVCVSTPIVVAQRKWGKLLSHLRVRVCYTSLSLHVSPSLSRARDRRFAFEGSSDKEL